MGKKSQEREERIQASKKKQHMKYVKYGVFTLVAVFIVAAIVFFFPSSEAKAVSAAINEEGNLAIPYNEITLGVLNRFDYGGTQDIIVWVDSEYAVRTAYNTCFNCFSSGNATYTLNGEMLRCRNCGEAYDPEELGDAEWGGCKPVAIPESYRVDTDAEMIIPGDLLNYAEGMFDEWRNEKYDITLEFYGQL